MYTLDKRLTYDAGVAIGSNLSTIIPSILVPLLLVIFTLTTLIVLALIFYHGKRKKGNFETIATTNEMYGAFIHSNTNYSY